MVGVFGGLIYSVFLFKLQLKDMIEFKVGYECGIGAFSVAMKSCAYRLGLV